MKIKALFSVVVGSLLMFAVQAQNASNDELIKRIKPAGSVHVAGAQADVAAGPRSGADIYQSSCFACHGTGALGAPKSDDSADWSARLDKGFDTVLLNAITGINQMPAKGGCMACSDDDIKAAIEHMIKDI